MNKVKKYIMIFLLMIIVIVGLSINFLFKQMDSNVIPVVLDDNMIKIMNRSYNFEDVVDVEILEKVSLSGGSGSNTPNTNNGQYKVNGDKNESNVYIHKNVSPFIKLTTKDTVIVFNEDNSDKTKNIYNKLSNSIK